MEPYRSYKQLPSGTREKKSTKTSTFGLGNKRKKEHKDFNFWARRLPGGMGVFHAKGCGSKSSFPPSRKFVFSLGFEGENLGCPGNFAGMSRTPGDVQKVCAKKGCVDFPFPIFRNQLRLSIPMPTLVFGNKIGSVFAMDGNADQRSTRHRLRIPKNLLRRLLRNILITLRGPNDITKYN